MSYSKENLDADHHGQTIGLLKLRILRNNTSIILHGDYQMLLSIYNISATESKFHIQNQEFFSPVFSTTEDVSTPDNKNQKMPPSEDWKPDVFYLTTRTEQVKGGALSTTTRT